MVQHWCTVHAPWHVAMHLKKALLTHGGSMPRVWLACLGDPVAHNAYRHTTPSADVECSRMAALVWEDDAVAWACRVLPRFGQVWSLFVHDIVPVVDPIAKWEGGGATAFLQALPYYIAKLAA